VSLIGVCASIVARWKWHADSQADAAAHLRDCGYVVFYHPWHPLLFGTSDRPGIWRRWLGDKMFDEVRVVAGSNEFADNTLVVEDLPKAVQFLKVLPYSFYLDTSLASLHPAELDSLAGIANLESLHPNAIGPSAQSLQTCIVSLKVLSGLRNLDLSDLKIGDSSIENLSKLQQLRSLNVRGTDLSSDGLIRLKRAMPNCKIEDNDTPLGPCFPFEW
jgi:hypothetical protein